MPFRLERWGLVNHMYLPDESWGWGDGEHGPYLKLETYGTDTETAMYGIFTYGGIRDSLCTSWFDGGSFKNWGQADVLKSYDRGASWSVINSSWWEAPPIRTMHDSTASYHWINIQYSVQLATCTMITTFAGSTNTATKSMFFVAAPIWSDRVCGGGRYDISSETWLNSGASLCWGWGGSTSGAPTVFPGTYNIASSIPGIVNVVGQPGIELTAKLKNNGDGVFMYVTEPGLGSANGTAVTSDYKLRRVGLVEALHNRTDYTADATWTNLNTSIGNPGGLESLAPLAMIMDTSNKAHLFMVGETVLHTTISGNEFLIAGQPGGKYVVYMTYDTNGSFGAREDIHIFSTDTVSANLNAYGHDSFFTGHPSTFTFTQTISGTGTPAIGFAIPGDCLDRTSTYQPVNLVVAIKDTSTWSKEVINDFNRWPAYSYDYSASAIASQLFEYNGTLCCVYNVSCITDYNSGYKFRTYMAMRQAPGTWTNIQLTDFDYIASFQGAWFGGCFKPHARQITSTSIGVFSSRFFSHTDYQCAVLNGGYYSGYQRIFYSEIIETTAGGTGGEEGYGF